MKVRIKNVAVPVVLPPQTQLPVPRTVQPIHETRKLVAEQRVKVLVAQVSVEIVLLRQLRHLSRLQILCVELGRAHSLKVQQNDAGIQSRVSVARSPPTAAEQTRVGVIRTAQDGARVLLPVFVQRVPVDGRQLRRQTEEILPVEAVELVEQLFRVRSEHNVAVDENAAVQVIVHDQVQAQ